MKNSARKKVQPAPPACVDPKTADKLSQAIACIVRELRAGHSVNLPGLGNLMPGKQSQILGGERKDGDRQRKQTKRQGR
jgi:hypothetical protein